jgi:nicotinate-nucleotide pyrophosphorylase (carboxylating)
VKLQLRERVRRFAAWVSGGPENDTFGSTVPAGGSTAEREPDGAQVTEDHDTRATSTGDASAEAAASGASASPPRATGADPRERLWAAAAEAAVEARSAEGGVGEPSHAGGRVGVAARTDAPDDTDEEVLVLPDVAEPQEPAPTPADEPEAPSPALVDEPEAPSPALVDDPEAPASTGDEPEDEGAALVAEEQAATATVPPPAARPDRLPGDVVLDPGAVATAARRLVLAALREDLADDTDVTAIATIPPTAIGRADIVVRSRGMVAGTDLVAVVYDQLDPRVSVEMYAADGDRVEPGEVLGVVAGPLRSIVTGERTALNLLTHLSGVASATCRFVDEIAGTGCVVRDTRKTTPGMRLLEKAAVAAAGGVNHRLGLHDALLVKDNHVVAAGSVAAAVAHALAAAGGRPVQIEVDTLEELEAAVAAGARDLMLDNFDLDTTRAAVARCRALSAELGERILLESSGTVTLDTVRAYAETGVDRVAVGAITHSAPQLDIGLDVQVAGAATPPSEPYGQGG